MGKEEKVDGPIFKEIESYMRGEKNISLPITIRVEKDDMPDIERWKKHE